MYNVFLLCNTLRLFHVFLRAVFVSDEVQPVPIQVPSVKPDPEKPNPKLGVGQIAFSGDNRYLATKNGRERNFLPAKIWYQIS